MLADSGLLQDIEQYAFSTVGQPMETQHTLKGSPSSTISRCSSHCPDGDVQYASMSSSRMSVEWLFGDIINSFKFLDFKKNLKIGLSSVGKMYVVSALIRNALTCLYGNETSRFFDLEPPGLRDYFV